MSSNPKTLPLSSEEYLKNAHDHYKNLIPYFYLDPNNPNNHHKYTNYQYWGTGCVLSGMIDFLKLAVKAGKVDISEAQNFLCKAADGFLDEKNPDEKNRNSNKGWWYDDWAWWCIATAKVFDPNYSELFDPPDRKPVDCNEDLCKKFIDICTNTFNIVMYGVNGSTDIKPNQSISSKYYQYFTGTMDAYNDVREQAKREMSSQSTQDDWNKLRDDCRPVWNLGCWDGPMRPGHDPIITMDPRLVQAPGIQDTLMSALVYIFTQRILLNEDEEERTENNKFWTYKELRCTVSCITEFFQNWMGSSPDSDELWSQHKIFNELTDNSDGPGLFRERVGRFKNLNTEVLAFHPELAWAGDQGLMLQALTLLYNSPKNSGTLFDGKSPLEIMEAVINGVFGHGLATIDTHNDVIMPWCHVGSDPKEQPGLAPTYDKKLYDKKVQYAKSHDLPIPPKGDPNDFFSGTGVFMTGLLEAMNIFKDKEGNDIIKSIVNENINVLQSTIAALKDNEYTVRAGVNLGNPTVSMFNEYNKMATYLVASQWALLDEDKEPA